MMFLRMGFVSWASSTNTKSFQYMFRSHKDGRYIISSKSISPLSDLLFECTRRPIAIRMPSSSLSYPLHLYPGSSILELISNGPIPHGMERGSVYVGRNPPLQFLGYVLIKCDYLRLLIHRHTLKGLHHGSGLPAPGHSLHDRRPITRFHKLENRFLMLTRHENHAETSFPPTLTFSPFFIFPRRAFLKFMDFCPLFNCPHLAAKSIPFSLATFDNFSKSRAPPVLVAPSMASAKPSSFLTFVLAGLLTPTALDEAFLTAPSFPAFLSASSSKRSILPGSRTDRELLRIRPSLLLHTIPCLRHSSLCHPTALTNVITVAEFPLSLHTYPGCIVFISATISPRNKTSLPARSFRSSISFSAGDCSSSTFFLARFAILFSPFQDRSPGIPYAPVH